MKNQCLYVSSRLLSGYNTNRLMRKLGNREEANGLIIKPSLTSLESKLLTDSGSFEANFTFEGDGWLCGNPRVEVFNEKLKESWIRVILKCCC